MRAERVVALADLVRIREAERLGARVLVYDATTRAVVRRILCPQGAAGFTFHLPDNGRARPA